MAGELRSRFVDKGGTVRCRDLRIKFFGKFFNPCHPVELRAAIEKGWLDTCPNVAAEAVRMTVDIILDEKIRTVWGLS
ncbi:MAG: C_GCAxxG_C_C family protein [Bacteriovoracaceae bacterium]|nr:C_GCAxxG_C_C family protein [Bacteriovoracaceae bacterium]HNR51030.1 hypothetical protein [Deltaproteobacteria bacterium]HRR20411.1 hypothetical protein [Desulfomonilia bacterium]HPW69912.1 hypothetical protein [Deltaproteobacteria bacterium]HRR67857.1 hypothetical protein [Desulfomonilia bacterium]